jgi:hypothetical protein
MPAKYQVGEEARGTRRCLHRDAAASLAAGDPRRDDAATTRP